MTFDPTIVENSCPPPPKQKLFKEQRNLSRKRDLKPVSQTDAAKNQLPDRCGEKEEAMKRAVTSQHEVEEDVETDRVDNVGIGDNQRTRSHQNKLCSKHKSSSCRRVGRKPCFHAAAVNSPCDSPAPTVPSSPSQASIISDTAAEELCDLRNYYSKQLKRINYVSLEHLRQPAEPGMLSCIREPLRSLRLPRRVTIAQTARSLWTRVSGRRQLVHR